jgi:hypothetical protein
MSYATHTGRVLSGRPHHGAVRLDPGETPAGRRCYFCGGAGRFTKEHAWPDWIRHRGFADLVEPDRVTTQVGFSRTSEDTFTEHPNLRRRRQGSTLTIKVREVCATCNHGWMSQLEKAIQPILGQLWSTSVDRLNSAQAATLATWAVKTAWMHERAANDDPTPTPEQRRQLLDSTRPPPFTSVYAGRRTGPANFQASVVRIVLDQGPRPQTPQPTGTRRVMLAALLCNNLALLVRTDDGPHAPALAMRPDLWLQLWPRTTRGQLPWPPPGTVTDDDVRSRLAFHADWVRLPDVPHFERAVPGWREQDPGRGRPAPPSGSD